MNTFFASNPRTANRRVWAGVLATGFLAWQASASVVLDLRASQLNGAALSGSNSAKNIGGLKPGDVITFSLHAQVTGAFGNGGLEGFQLFYFSLLSSSGGLLGDFSNGVSLNPTFNSQAQAGKAHDLDGDGDLDLGSTSASATTASPSGSFPGTDYVAAHSSTLTTAGTPILDGTEFVLGIATFTVTNTANPGSITANFSVPTFTVGGSRIAGLWVEDGAAKQIGGTGTGTAGVGVPVVLSAVPEPSSALLFAAGILGLAGVRRPRLAPSR